MFSQKKFFLYFGKWNFLENIIFQEGTSQARKIKKKLALRNVFIFWEMELSSPMIEKILHFF